MVGALAPTIVVREAARPWSLVTYSVGSTVVVASRKDVPGIVRPVLKIPWGRWRAVTVLKSNQSCF